jgi:hypothetical protein
MASHSDHSSNTDLPALGDSPLADARQLRTIGSGQIGGKAQGLARIRKTLAAEFDPSEFPTIHIDIPWFTVICTDIFDAFMRDNNLYETAYADLPDEQIASAFQQAVFPNEVLEALRPLVENFSMPLAVRSSSLMEDAKHMPLAGVYITKMIPNQGCDADTRLNNLVKAVKLVYASTFFMDAKGNFARIEQRIEDEKMAVIIQKTVGGQHGQRYYPELSGVARTYSYYPFKPAKPQDGVVSLALGLGKTIVDGGASWIYSPLYPKVAPPFGSINDLLKSSQTEFWSIDMEEPCGSDPADDTEYMQRQSIITAKKDGALRYLASTFNPQSGRLTPGISVRGPRALTFAPLLVMKEIPVNELLIRLMSICEQAFETPVEIEFAMTFNPNHFAFLQVRAMVIPEGNVEITPEEMNGQDVMLASETVFGNGVNDTVKDIVYIKPDNFELRHTRMAVSELEKMNAKLVEAGKPYLLVVFGRLGTADPWLGIPIPWRQINGAKIIVEATKENIKVELSQGSHFFHNIINLNILYFCLPHASPYSIDWEWLDQQELVEETRFLRHVQLPKPLNVRVDGRANKGVIRKN